jgi:hypothetical protein
MRRCDTDPDSQIRTLDYCTDPDLDPDPVRAVFYSGSQDAKTKKYFFLFPVPYLPKVHLLQKIPVISR